MDYRRPNAKVVRQTPAGRAKNINKKAVVLTTHGFFIS
jgi:hypothetical protein